MSIIPKSILLDIDSDFNFLRKREEYFDFKTIAASSGVYGIHPYPAMLHFLLVRELLNKYSHKDFYIFDPFLGSGVVAVESLIGQRKFAGIDINPLAVLISRVRATPIQTNILSNSLSHIISKYFNTEPEAIYFFNIDFWFDREIIDKLSKIRRIVFSIENNAIKDFFAIAFSETVRKVSRTKFNEFKLIRKKAVSQNNVIESFTDISLKNIKLLSDFYRNVKLDSSRIAIETGNILSYNESVDKLHLYI